MSGAPAGQPHATPEHGARSKKLQLLGVVCGLAAGAWLGTAEAPTKLVTIGLSPIVISLMMVVGVFLARWSLPALIIGTSSIRSDVQHAPHLIVWGILAGCMWAVANTLTIFAIRDIGLSIAFPLWNSNSLLGIFWGFLFFRELRRAGWQRWAGVLGGTAMLCVGGALLAIASSTQGSANHSLRGVWEALGAGALWGTMYIPYRKAYLSGMNPLSFVTFFTVGELGMMSTLAVSYLGIGPLWQEISAARTVLFWLMAAGFVWVIGDLFQQYAAKYLGISRGIPLSNSNQLWGLVWGIFVFGELHGSGASTYWEVVGGSLLMLVGVGAIALSSTTGSEQQEWSAASRRECERYRMSEDFVRARMSGMHGTDAGSRRRGVVDWSLVLCATAVFIFFGAIARAPMLPFSHFVAIIVGIVIVILGGFTGAMLWRTTRFN